MCQSAVPVVELSAIYLSRIVRSASKEECPPRVSVRSFVGGVNFCVDFPRETIGTCQEVCKRVLQRRSPIWIRIRRCVHEDLRGFLKITPDESRFTLVVAEGKNDGAKNLGTAILVKKLGRKFEIFCEEISVLKVVESINFRGNWKNVYVSAKLHLIWFSSMEK